jgi:phosphopantetheine adenylyltransferase
MTHTIEQILKLEVNDFEKMSGDELKEINEQIKVEKKRRTKEYIKPLMDEHIKPVKEEYLKPLNKIHKDLKTFLPSPKAKKAYLTINGTKYGPLTKKEFLDMIIEVD